MSLPEADHRLSSNAVLARASPPLTHVYTADDYEGPFPIYDCHNHDQVEHITPYVVKLSPELVVKYGPCVRLNEYEALLYVEKMAPGVKAPRIYACYTVGPYEERGPATGGKTDTYLIMTYIPGAPLDEAWGTLNDEQKSSIAAQIRSNLRLLRAIPQSTTSRFCSVTGGPLDDHTFRAHPNKGSFNDEAEFNQGLLCIHEAAFGKANLGTLLIAALEQQKPHKAVFTHSDLQRWNIMVDGGALTGIIDWEYSGWYPEYWEYARMFRSYGFTRDWPDFVATAVDQIYPTEWAILDLLTQHVW